MIHKLQRWWRTQQAFRAEVERLRDENERLRVLVLEAAIVLTRRVEDTLFREFGTISRDDAQALLAKYQPDLVRRLIAASDANEVAK